jgi:hypothetical protein
LKSLEGKGSETEEWLLCFVNLMKYYGALRPR